jgi:hypothetical protein
MRKCKMYYFSRLLAALRTIVAGSKKEESGFRLC